MCASLLLAVCCACSRSSASEPEAPKGPVIPKLAVVKAAYEDMSRQMVLTAEFRPFQEVEVMAKVAGYVKTIYVDVGDRVKQGQLLAVLEIPEMADDLTRGRAALDRGEAEVARYKDEVKRAESAHEMVHLTFTRLADVAKQRAGLVAQQEVDDARGRDLVAEAQVNVAQSSLMAASEQVRVNAAELKRSTTMLEYTKVTAPFAGVITRRYADTGSMVQAGTASSTQALPLVKVSENSELRLILPVPESAVPSVRIGQAVEVRVPTTKRSFPGRVARFSEKVSTATRTMDTEVDVPNPGLILIPGMYAEVDLTLERRAHTLAVPLQAVDGAGDGAREGTTGKVMVVTPEHLVDVRPVKLGLQTATSVEVLSGLNEGDLVVVGSRAGLKAGQQAEGRVTAAGSAK